MSRIRRGGFIFVTWIGDHEPHHVHVYRDDRLILRWNLETWRPMTGDVTARVLEILARLRREGRL
jgi:hypothetical protein